MNPKYKSKITDEMVTQVTKDIIVCLRKQNLNHRDAIDILEKCKIELIGIRLGGHSSYDKLEDVIDDDYLS